jgi:hypothetical protein
LIDIRAAAGQITIDLPVARAAFSNHEMLAIVVGSAPFSPL